MYWEHDLYDDKTVSLEEQLAWRRALVQQTASYVKICVQWEHIDEEYVQNNDTSNITYWFVLCIFKWEKNAMSEAEKWRLVNNTNSCINIEFRS